MARITVAYGYERRGNVPDIQGTTVKSCNRCKKWFAARKRERVCHGCLRPSEKSRKKVALDHHPRAPRSLSVIAGQKGSEKVIYSEYLDLTFRCPKRDPRYASLECRVLAYEEAARQKWSKSGKTS